MPTWMQRKLIAVLTLFVFLGLTLCAVAQTQTPTDQKPAEQKPADQKPAEAGGPQGEMGPIAVPKKKEDKPAPKLKPETVKNPPEIGDFSLRVSTAVVNVDVSVVTKDGQFIPGLKKENFKIYEDGVPQTVTNLEQTEAPITAVMLMEFAQPNFFVNQQTYAFLNNMLMSGYVFVQSTKKEDWIALVSYDIKPTMLVDFTQDKGEILNALNRMRVPLFSETNLFDALYDTIDRLETLEGRKYIIVVATGIDTFSKLTLDKILAKIKASRDITIYCVGTGGAFRAQYGDRLGPITSLNYLQAENQLNTFARMTGGRAYLPRFSGELPEIFRDIAQTIRNQYMVTYKPTNAKQDGTYRKIKVEVIAPDGGPLRVQNEKGKAIKFQVIARDGYRAKQVVE